MDIKTATITVGDIYSILHTPKLIPTVRKLCRAHPQGYRYMSRYVSHEWDGYITLMTNYNKFPTGLLQTVVTRLYDLDIDVRLIYDTQYIDYAKVTADVLQGVTLRDYQVKAANKLLDSRRGIAAMATNSGKTEIISALLYSLGGGVVIVHRKDLMYQTVERIEKRLGCDVGMIGDGIYNVKPVTVAMIQTLHSRYNADDFAKNQLVIVDECHHVSSNRMMDILMIIPGAFRYGFSGTPLKYQDLADLKLVAATGDVIVNVTNAELIQSGYSAQPQVYLHTISQPDCNGMNFQGAYERCIVANIYRNAKIAEIARNAKGIVLILVDRIEHGELLQTAIKQSLFVSGKHDTQYRQDVLSKMRKGGSGVYIATNIFDEGIDVPAIDVVILAGGGKSRKNVLQRVGRGIRKKGGDNVLAVHDFIDDTNDYLFNHSDARVQVYKDEQFEVSLAR